MDRRIIALSQSEDPEALYHLGLSYAQGDGVPQSFDRAVDYFYKSAKLKYTKAMYCLGEAAYLGLGDNKSKATARTYIYMAF